VADFTTTGLLASIRRRASIPTAASTGSQDADLLAYANEELRLGLVSRIIELREEYYKRDSDQTLTSATAYLMPTRALGGKLRSVALLDAAGAYLANLYEIRDERLPDFGATTTLAGYRYQGAYLVLQPTSTTATSATTLRMTYFEQPNELVTGLDSTSGAPRTITAVNTALKTVTMTNTTGYTTSTACDFVRASSHFESLAIDQTPTVVAGTTLTFAALPTGLLVGDYVCLARQSPVPQVPLEFQPILAQRAACKWLEAGGYAKSLAAALTRLKSMEEDIGVLSSPRNDGSPKKIINRSNALGPRRRNVYRVS
jgi:hypothetical protein